MKIYRRSVIDDLMASYHAHFLPFDLEKDLWTFTDSMHDADVIAVLTKYGISEIQKQIDCIRPYYTNQTIVIISLFHIDETTDITQSHDYQIDLWKPLTDNVVVVHTNRENKNQILLADDISPDSCRLWDENTSEKLDKDRFRRDLGGLVEAYQEVANRLKINF